MSRHRNVRSMRYSDEYDGYDDVYGHSVEDECCISPSDAAFMYDRSSRQPQISSFLTAEEDIAEEDEGHDDQKRSYPVLSDIDEAKLKSCLDEARNVIGDSVAENTLIDTIIATNFNIEATLNKILNQETESKKTVLTGSPKPQRTARNRHIERDMGKALEVDAYVHSESNLSEEKSGKNNESIVENAQLKKGKPSSLARMLCSKRETKQVYFPVKLTRPLWVSFWNQEQTKISPFAFDVMSPDDKALQFRKQKRT